MKCRVAQWGTGIVGRHAARAVIDHPEMQLVACFAFSPDKVGQDAGVLAGVAPIGVAATDKLDDIIAARPDCVLYMPSRWDIEALEHMLHAGINVVTTVSFVTGGGYSEGGLDRIKAAALKGNASFFETGIYPGFANALGLMATSPCRRVDHVSVFESVDCTNYPSRETWESMGFGLPLDTPGLEQHVESLMGMFRDAVAAMGPALKVDLEDVVFSAEFATATEDLALGYMDIAKGMICGVTMGWKGMYHGRSLIELRQMWRVGYAMTPDWPAFGGYQIEVKGEPSARCTYEFSGLDATNGGVLTALPAVHSIAGVCAAPAGYVTPDQLPLPVATYRVPD